MSRKPINENNFEQVRPAADEVEVFYPQGKAEWRAWLEQNYQIKQSVWLVYYRKSTGKKTLTWSEAVDMALCFGWIDSKQVKIDNEKSHQFFSKRKAKSVWSKINKEKINRLSKEGLMTEAGWDSVTIAKQNGSWSILDEVEELIVPEDLEAAFKGKKIAEEYFLSLSKSTRKAMLQWLVMAKRAETRQNRITEIVAMAEQKLKPKHLQ